MGTGLLGKHGIRCSFQPIRLNAAILSIGASLLSIAQADVIWFAGNNPITNLEYQTGQSSGGFGREVEWKDTTIKPTTPHQIGGAREDLSVIQYQPVPPLQTYMLFSFNDAFGTGANQISSSNVILSAQLWLNVSQVAGEQTITIQGLRPADADWTESQASFSLKDESMSSAWFGGGDFSGSLLNNYGTIGNPSTTGWMYIDITSAFQDYQRNLISGIALISSATPTAEIRNFYAHANEAADFLQAPGLYVSYMIPEPGVLGLALCGLGMLFWTHRRRFIKWTLTLGLGAGLTSAKADQVWLYGGNDVTTLEQATGQSAGGLGQSVAWKDAQFKSTTDLQAGGRREIIGVIQRQQAPPLEGFVILSLNDLFGSTGHRITPSSEIQEAWLWVYVTQTTKQMPITVQGIRPDDRDWGEATASFFYKENTAQQAWNAGVAESACLTNYGIFNAPAKAGWFKVPVDLATALNDYRDGLIGGIALVAPKETTPDIHAFYFCSNEHPQAGRRPGIFARFTESALAPESKGCVLGDLSAEDDTAQIRLQAAQAANVQVNGQSAVYEFGGVWTFDLLTPPDESSREYQITLVNEAGAITQRVTATSSFAAIQDFSLQDQKARLAWATQAHQAYTIFYTPTLNSPSWAVVPNGGASVGETEWNTDEWAPQQGFYRIKSLTLDVAN